MRETRPGVWGAPGPVCGTHGGEAGTGGAGRVGAALCPCRPGPRGPCPACSEEPPATLRTAGLCRGPKASGSEDGDRQEPWAPRSRSLWTTREARRWPGLDSPSGHSGRGRRGGRGCGAASPRCSDLHPGGAAWVRLTDPTPPVHARRRSKLSHPPLQLQGQGSEQAAGPSTPVTPDLQGVLATALGTPPPQAGNSPQNPYIEPVSDAKCLLTGVEEQQLEQSVGEASHGAGAAENSRGPTPSRGPCGSVSWLQDVRSPGRQACGRF